MLIKVWEIVSPQLCQEECDFPPEIEYDLAQDTPGRSSLYY